MRLTKKICRYFIACVTAAAFVGVSVWFVGHSPVDRGTIAPEENLEIFDSPSTAEREPNTLLPFKIIGVDDGGAVHEALEIALDYSVASSWSFGGDYSRIGSLPLSPELIFGSGSETPDNLRSYRPALIGTDEVEYIAPLTDNPHYEPRDGTGSADGLTWYASTLNEAHESNVNNWLLSAWREGDEEATALGSAAELNGRDDTPALPGELVPTMNRDHVYYASNVWHEGSWIPSVLEYAVDGSNAPRVLAAGSYPAAIPDGVLFATNQIESEASELGYSTLARFDGGDVRDVLSVNTAESSWCISGIWASSGLKVVAFSNAREDLGCYLGFWRGDFDVSVAWVHVASPSVIGSIAQHAFVWGAGSQENNAQMFAFQMSKPGQLVLLGEAPGYARPAISSDGKTLLVPVYNGMDAVKFDVVPFE